MLAEAFAPKPLNAEWLAGAGTISGLRLMMIVEPTTPTAEDSKKPGFDRSIRNHKKGFTRVRASETWRVEAHGVLRYTIISSLSNITNPKEVS